MGATDLIPVAEARERILRGVEPLPGEIVSLSEALGRVTAAPITARRTQPPCDMSAMDGYAVRAADLTTIPATLRRIGTAAAGRPYDGVVEPGACVRIFTGAAVPQGADAIALQEDAAEDKGGLVTVRQSVRPGQHVRAKGLDFSSGDQLIGADHRIGVRDIGLAAAMNVPWVEVRRRPRVAVLSTGDEIARPGEPLGPTSIASSNSLLLCAFVRRFGGDPVDIGVAHDDPDHLGRMIDRAKGFDVLVTTGGASVGEHDLVQGVLAGRGLALDFWRIAMRPGKPLMFGRLGETRVLGLPGNPVSTFVCAALFLRPLLLALQQLGDPTGLRPARLGRDLPANDRREDYLRCRIASGEDGLQVATPFEIQDSSMMSFLAASSALLVRAPFAPPAKAGETVEVLSLDGSASID